ncbi:hypothetical protein Tco_0972854 [Tanacetum coccineum]
MKPPVKNHFHPPIYGIMLERIAGKRRVLLFSLMDCTGYFQIPLTLVIKKRTTLLVPTERLPTVACLSAYAMHQARSKGVCAIFHDMVEKKWKCFMDGLLVFGNHWKIASDPS